MIKKISLVAAFLSMVLIASACSNETKEITTPVEIHVPILTPGQGAVIINQILKDAANNFNQLNPKIKVTLEPLPNTPNDIMDLLQDDNSPDISLITENILPTAEKKQLLYDLKQLSRPQEIDIPDRILDTVKINGKLLALPFAANPYVVFYNKDFFDKAHVPYPQGDWTWEQFRDISKKINSKGKPDVTYDLSTMDLLMGSIGKGILSPKGDTAVGYLDSPEAIRTLQWLNGVYHDNEQSNPLYFQKISSQFMSYETGMYVNLSNNYIFIKDKLGDKLGVAQLPHFEGGKRANPARFYMFGISKKSKHPQEAWKFIQFLTLTKHENAGKMAGYYLVTSKSISESIGQTSDPDKSIAMDEMNYAVKPSGNDDQLLSKAWNDSLNGQFQSLLMTNDKDVPIKLHNLALNLDKELNRLKMADDQQTKSTSP